MEVALSENKKAVVAVASAGTFVALSLAVLFSGEFWDFKQSDGVSVDQSQSIASNEGSGEILFAGREANRDRTLR